MAQGSGSARPSLVVAVAVFCLLAVTQPTLAAIYGVGARSGWTYNVQNWPNGKSFRAGDVLAFNYDKRQHNVAQVSQIGYKRCSAPRGSRIYQSGRDRIKLNRGMNYFICTFKGHCQSGMKIAIKAN